MVVWAFDRLYNGGATQWEFIHDSREYQRVFSKAVDSKAGVFVDQSWMSKTLPYEGDWIRKNFALALTPPKASVT